MRAFLSRFLPELTPVSKRERLRSAAGALVGILATGLVCRASVPTEALPILIAPMGASAVLLFAVPASPLAQPWSILGGNVVAALVGVTAAARDVWRGDVPYLQSVRDFPANSPLDDLFSGAMNEGKWAQFVSQPFASFARPGGVAQTRYEARKYRWTQFVSRDEATKAFTADLPGWSHSRSTRRSPVVASATGSHPWSWASRRWC